MPGHLVDLLLDDCVDDLLNTCVHNQLRLSNMPLNDLYSEGNIWSFIGLLHKTLLNPALLENLRDLHQFLHILRNGNDSDVLRGPLLDSVFGYGLSAISPTARPSPVQGTSSISSANLGTSIVLLDNLWTHGASAICSQILSEICSEDQLCSATMLDDTSTRAQWHGLFSSTRP